MDNYDPLIHPLILIKLFDISSKGAKLAWNGAKAWHQKRSQHNEVVTEFLSTFAPNVDTLRTLAMACSRDQKPVRTDLNAAKALAARMRDSFSLERKECTFVSDSIADLSSLFPPQNLSLFGGPNINIASHLALGFKGRQRYRRGVDISCPVWSHGILRYYSISDYEEFSPPAAVAAFEGHLSKTGKPNFSIPDLVWGIATYDKKERSSVAIPKLDREWTLLLTRLPNLFNENSTGYSPSQGLLIVDGVHGKATEAFRLLFKQRYTGLLRKITSAIRNQQVFQVPLVVTMSGNDVRDIKLDQRCPIHTIRSVERAVLRDLHQYIVSQVTTLMDMRSKS